MRHNVLVFPYRIDGGCRQYLLLKRVAAHGGFWQPVTGGVEPDEPAEAAAVRELTEETALTGRLVVTGLTGSFSWYGTHWQEDVFAWHVAGGSVILGPEHEAYRWCGLAEAWWCLFWPLNRQHLAAIDRMLADPAAAA